MALFNEIGVPRFNAILNKLLQMKDSAPAPQLASEIMAVIVLESDRPEFKFLGGEKLAIGFGAAALTAGQFSGVKLFNPANSGLLLVLEKVYVLSSVANSWVIRRASNNFATTTNTQLSRDTRFGTTEIPAGVIQTDITTAAVTSGAQIGFLPGIQSGAAGNQISNVYDMPHIFTPGQGIVIHPGVVAADVSCMFCWRERASEPSELR